MVRQLKDGTVLFGVGLFMLGIYMLKASLGWGVYGSEGPGPGFFPFIYGLVMVVFSPVLVLQAVQARKGAPTPSAGAVEKAGSAPALAAWIVLMASVPLMSWLGFVGGFGLALFFLVRVVFLRSTLSSAVIAAAIVFGLYVVFGVLIGLPLPVGKLWNF
jgi:putative tricarboxylic transport membrane protein